MYTTNEEDRKEAARLQARLADSNEATSHDAAKEEFDRVPSVSIDPGAHKYVLIRAVEPTEEGKEQHFVISQRGAKYHRNAAEPMLQALQMSGYRRISIVGGGRISFEPKEKNIKIFGFSYSFGQANHGISKSLVEADTRYKDYTISISNEGY